MLHQPRSQTALPILRMHEQQGDKTIIKKRVFQSSISKDFLIGDNEATACLDGAQNKFATMFINLRYRVKRINLFNITFYS